MRLQRKRFRHRSGISYNEGVVSLFYIKFYIKMPYSDSIVLEKSHPAAGLVSASCLFMDQPLILVP